MVGAVKFFTSLGQSNIRISSPVIVEQDKSGKIGRGMLDYSKGKIYLIRNAKDATKVYVGSTTQNLCERMADHRRRAKYAPDAKFYKAIIADGVENFSIELYEDYPCERHEQILKRESEVIRLLDSVRNGYNSRLSLNSEEERKEQQRKDYVKKCEKMREDEEFRKKVKDRLKEWKVAKKKENDDMREHILLLQLYNCTLIHLLHCALTSSNS